MGERPTIAFRVSESQKGKWESYADEKDEYDSLSHLIRVAVAHEMSDEYGPRSGSETSGESSRMGEVLTTLEKVERRLTEVEEGVTDATKAVYSGSKVPQNAPSEGEILSALPYGEENAMSAYAIAVEMGIDHYETAQWIGLELSRLSNNSQIVQRVDKYDGMAWKEAILSGRGPTTVRFYRVE